MEIIEEDVVQEGQGTDFKKRNRLGINTKSSVVDHLSPKM